MNLTNITNIKKLLEKYDTTTKKSLGQNFLINESVLKKIASMSKKLGNTGISRVLEIGPGIGSLTYELSMNYSEVVAVEIDKKLKPIHNELFSDVPNVNIIYSDILKIDINDFINTNFKSVDSLNSNGITENKINVCANLPYYITTPIISKLIESRNYINSITIMVQKEVADRLCADEKDKKNYGSISLFIKYHCNAKKLFNVSSNNFLPQPKVNSTVVNLELKNSLIMPVEDEKMLFKIIRASFEQRRKTLINSLSSAFYDIDKSIISDIIKYTLGNENIRGEELSLVDFIEVYKKFKEL